MEGKSALTPMLGTLLRTPLRAISARITADLATNGYGDLRPTHLTVFQHLPADGARATVLAEQAQMTKQSMGALIEYLDQHGYIERAPDPVDQRARVIRRTARGWAVEQVARASLRQLEDEWSAGLGVGRMQELRGILWDLAALLGR